MSKREIYRILDAAANRGREALRVVEDAVRFLDDSEALTPLLKDARHRFAAVADKLDRRERILARDTTGDVGTTVETQDEYQRASLLDVLVANFARLEESARSLEEFSKIVEPKLAREWEQIRYSAYTLEKIVYQAALDAADAQTSDEEPAPQPAAEPESFQPAESDAPDVPRPCAQERADAAPEPPEAPAPEPEPQNQPQTVEPADDQSVDEPEPASEPEAPSRPRPAAATSSSSGASLRGARRAKLYASKLCVYVDRDLPTAELRELLDSSADVFELSFDHENDAERVEQTENFLRQWFNKNPNATRSLDDRPLLLSRDTRLWGEALDGWVVPIESAVDARDVIGPDALLGVVVSTRDQALAALQAWSTGYVDFIEVGPVFTDQGSVERTDVEFLRALSEIFSGPAPLPIFAFGGVNERNCGEVLDAGIDRLGIGDAILGAPDKRAAVERFKSLC